MADESPESPQRWTAKRRAAPVVSILKGETSVPAAARKHGTRKAMSVPTLPRIARWSRSSSWSRYWWAMTIAWGRLSRAFQKSAYLRCSPGADDSEICGLSTVVAGRQCAGKLSSALTTLLAGENVVAQCEPIPVVG